MQIAFQRVEKLSTRWEAVQKGVRFSEWNPKVYVDTSRGDTSGKTSEKVLETRCFKDFCENYASF